MTHPFSPQEAGRTFRGVLISIGLAIAASTLATVASAQEPDLGDARDFAILGASAVTNTGPTVIVGNIGVSPGSEINGFPPGVVTGTINSANPAAVAAHASAQTAYDFLQGMPSIPANNLSGSDLGGMTLSPGVYKFNTSAQLTGALVLDAGGDSNADRKSVV